jgi:hypothetical protein
VKGTVKLAGKAPCPEVIDLRSSPLCAQKHPEGMQSEDLVVDKEGGIRRALVYVGDVMESQRFEIPKDPVTLSLSGCRYGPHVAVVIASQQLRILNRDDQIHRVTIYRSPGEKCDVSTLEPGASTGSRFSHGPLLMTPFAVRCDLHPWEVAWVGVSGHPFWAITDDRGSYEITNLLAGRYALRVWHERCKDWINREIDVAENADTTADFELSIKPR